MSEENNENATKSDSNFAVTFADDHVLPDIHFIEHCLINNIFLPKKRKYRFYMKELLIWICKTN